jgi:hypothetical protein
MDKQRRALLRFSSSNVSKILLAARLRSSHSIRKLTFREKVQVEDYRVNGETAFEPVRKEHKGKKIHGGMIQRTKGAHVGLVFLREIYGEANGRKARAT